MGQGSNESTCEVLIAGAGIGGISAAIASARLGVRTLLVERDQEIGGTGVHSPVGLVCSWHARNGSAINAGLVRRFFPDTAAGPRPDRHVTYDERDLLAAYYREISSLPALEMASGVEVAEVQRSGERIDAVRLSGAREGWVTARVFIDGTADGNLSAFAGATWEMGRKGDGGMQPSTLTFKVSGIDYSKIEGDPPMDGVHTKADKFRVYEALLPLYRELRRRGGTTNHRDNILCFPYPDDQALLFNQTRILGVDPTSPQSVAAGIEEGRRQIEEFWGAVSKHPALRDARIEKISSKLGIREGRRVMGDYVLTKDDCLGEARFDDMVAACGYSIDIHNPQGSGTEMVSIPGSGYYHIPYRCLTARGSANLLLGSRCISGTHEAHSSYRVMPPVCSIGEAAGTAAALAAHDGTGDIRSVGARRIRRVLGDHGQFVEGGIV